MRQVKAGEFNKKKYKFFLLGDADKTLNQRYVMGNVEEMWIRYGFSREYMRNMVKLMITQGKDKDIKKEALQNNILKIAFNIEGRIGMLAETKQYEQLALIYTRLEYDGEMEPEDFAQSWQQKKLDIWSSNKALRDFFLCMAIKRTHDLKAMSKKDIINVLRQIEAKAAQLPKLASILTDTSKTPTT